MSNGNQNHPGHFYLLYVVYSGFILIAATQIYKKQKSCLKPEIILVISLLAESAICTCVLALYLALVREFGFDQSSWALILLECFFIVVTFYKCLDYILQQVHYYLAMTRTEKYLEVRKYHFLFPSSFRSSTMSNP